MGLATCGFTSALDTASSATRLMVPTNSIFTIILPLYFAILSSISLLRACGFLLLAMLSNSHWGLNLINIKLGALRKPSYAPFFPVSNETHPPY